MTNETKQRIKMYEEALPQGKGKLAAAGMMLLIAMTVVVATTYAWVTLSLSPAVSNITTTIASNGSLEIGLAAEDGSEPLEFDIDESQNFSTDVTVSNRRWGNLINLSDSSYGMENIILRPAQLNTAAIKTSPLYGADYGTDGRIQTLSSDFIYVAWNGSEFQYSSSKGVRAIASYYTTVSDASMATWNTMSTAVVNARSTVDTLYSQVPGKLSSMSTMLSNMVQQKVDGTDSVLTENQLKQVWDLYNTVYQAMLAQEEVYVALANFQLYTSNANAYVALTWEDIVANQASYNTSSTTTTSQNGVVSLVGLTTFIADLETAKTDVEYLKQYYDNTHDGTGSYTFYTGGVSGHQVSNAVANLIDYSDMTMIYDGSEIKLTDLKNQMYENGEISYSAAMSFYNKMNGNHTNVYLVDGIMKRFEQLAVSESARLQGQSNSAVTTIKFSKSVSIITLSVTIYGDCYTKASGSAWIAISYENAKGEKLVSSDAVAQDTYGMAVDFWVRSNAENTYLTLEGAVTTDGAGEVISYDGVNRVWGSTGQSLLTTDSTTQGSGSCYIYYADTPEDMARSLSLLQSMKVAFVTTSDGTLLATASMDTDNALSVNGRVTVPLVIDETAGLEYSYTDDEDVIHTVRTITTLVIDEAKDITAIIYLDGVMLTNDDVLASADITGQLNLQFGSTTLLSTVGDNKLLTATRSVTAEATRTEMDYDTAVTEADLTTDVLVEIDGTTASSVTAFFIRAVNSSQGQRETTMTFTQQEDGTWTSTYTFTAPGTYYLRHVRLDGVDYALDDPVKITVSGFALSSVTWGEAGDEAIVYSTNETYQETVSVRYATDDQSLMPTSVQARFIRDDGVAVNVDLRYNTTTGAWTGTGTFQTSGTYTLAYLVQNSKYDDLETKGMSKTLTLYLGMSTEVFNDGSTTNDMYDADAEKDAYYKNVAVKLYDNAGNEMQGLNGVILKYSQGSSLTQTVDTDLVWDADREMYTGTLQITKAGRYVFSSVIVNGNSLTKATESPTYVIVSPDPPVYVESVASYYNGQVQFAPGTNDAYLGPIKVDHSASARMSAVLTNSLTPGEEYTVTMSNSGTKTPGTMYYEDGYWYIILPTYMEVDEDGNPVAGAVYTQEGEWQLTSLSIWDCYDEDGRFVEESDPIIIDETNADLSMHTTIVSCSINATMDAGTTQLGSATTAFMTAYTASGTGMAVSITDDYDRTIPTGKISDISLNLSYTDNTDVYTYGYEVSGYSKTFKVSLNSYDVATGTWKVSGDATWEYVGEYKVTSLEVTLLNGSTITLTPGQYGVPEMYTVQTAAPSAENLEIVSLNQSSTVFGKTGNNVTGTFLQSYSTGVSATVSLKYTDSNGVKQDAGCARVEGVSLSLNLAYQDGKTAPNGGYSWSGTSEYENITLAMTETRKGSGTYTSGSSILLAGTYKLTGTLTVDGTSISKDLGTLSNITVYSKAPTLKVTGVTPGVGTSYQMNTYTGEYAFLYDNAVLVDVQNYYSDKLANVYIQVGYTINETSEYKFVDYTLPKVELTLEGAGTSFSTASAAIDGTSHTFTFNKDTLKASCEIGTIGSDTYEYTFAGDSGCGSDNNTIQIPYETQTAIGEKQITALSLISGNITYRFNLSEEDRITIREESVAPPSISYISVDGYDSVKGQSSTDGGSFTVVLPSSIGTTTAEYDQTDDSVAWSTVSNTSEKLMYYSEGSVTTSDYTVTEGCNEVTYYKGTAVFTYYLYIRTTLVEKKTSSTQRYTGTYGLTGWKIGDQTYSPGETITVSGTVTAEPIIGVTGTPTPVGDPVTKTIMRTTVTDVSNGTETGTASVEKQTSKSDAETALKAKYNDSGVKPSGYSWFDATNPTKDGHNSATQVETVEAS